MTWMKSLDLKNDESRVWTTIRFFIGQAEESLWFYSPKSPKLDGLETLTQQFINQASNTTSLQSLCFLSDVSFFVSTNSVNATLWYFSSNLFHSLCSWIFPKILLINCSCQSLKKKKKAILGITGNYPYNWAGNLHRLCYNRDLILKLN